MDSLSVKRRLSCILAADAVGYSRHMGRDEIGAVRVLSAHRAVIDGIIAFHEGRIVGTAGDSVLAEFSSVVEAVRCAVEIQDAIKTRNDSLSKDQQMFFRIGINLGDVVVRENDLLGDGINVASRLETIAEPGGICISSGVYDQITGKLDLGFQDIGEQNLKNITRPIRVYRFSGTRPAVEIAPAPIPPPRVSRGWVMGAAGSAGVTLITIVIAWQAGWIRAAPHDSTTSPPPQAASPLVPPVPLPASAAAKPAEGGQLPPSGAIASPAPVAVPKAAPTEGVAPRPQRDPPLQQAGEPPEREVITRQSNAPRGSINTGANPHGEVDYVRSEFQRARSQALSVRANRAGHSREAATDPQAAPSDSTVIWRRRPSGKHPSEPRGP